MNGGPEAMTAAEAADYAPQWGSYMTSGDPGACMYGDAADAETARAMAAHVRESCLPIAEAGDCCGTSGPCESDVAELGRLLAYLDATGSGAPPA